MHQLSAQTVRLLSSSQVITSVLNVVKELTENALDAEATSVDVKLENFGLERIEVRDNGTGIRAEDAPVMGVRHFTSKISSHDDLENLQTYGFRGEALGSICAVAEVTVTTKTKDDDVSTQYSLDSSGNIVSQKPSHLGQGTTVSVQRLFKNLPVRRQIYSSSKKCREELKKVQEVLTAFAIIKPELRITLYHNKVVVWQKSKMADLRSALVATLGPSAVSNLLRVYHQHHEPEIVLEGFFPKPGADSSSTSSSSSDKSFIYINDRPVHSKDISKLIRERYSAQFSEEVRSKFPSFVLRVCVSAAEVDVNVTPDKTQVLLHHKEAVLAAVEDLLVSLYGPKPITKGHSKEEQPGPKMSKNTSNSNKDLEQDPIHISSETTTTINKNIHISNKEIPNNRSSDVSLHNQTSNSSSSSIAEDWIVNQIPSNFSICDDEELSQNCAKESNWTRNSPEKLDSEKTSKDKFTLEDWSRGKALRDPESNQPLLPVTILQPNAETSKKDANKNTEISNKLVSNSIIEKRAALTAYDVLANRAVRAPLSPAALFEKETRAEIITQNPKSSLHEINESVHERWKTLSREEKKRFEDKAQKHADLHERAKSASAEPPKRVTSQGQKRKTAPLSNQQLLDELFSAQPPKKTKVTPTKPFRSVCCSLLSLRQNLIRLFPSRASPPLGLYPLCRLSSQGSWLVLSGRKLQVLNPFRVEEALLFKRLMENNILPAEDLKEPIQLTEEVLGGAEFLEALRGMEQHSPDLDGSIRFSDLRLVANGFKVRLYPGAGQVQVVAAATCVPFVGVSDLREILVAVVQKRSRAVSQCRPLKVHNYLKGEAVRLVRQMPSHFSRAEVMETLRRMHSELEQSHRTCLHGRPFLLPLVDLPDTDQEARALAAPAAL